MHPLVAGLDPRYPALDRVDHHLAVEPAVLDEDPSGVDARQGGAGNVKAGHVRLVVKIHLAAEGFNHVGPSHGDALS